MLKWGQADISMGGLLPKSGRAHDPFSPLLPFLIGQWSINHGLQHQIWEQTEGSRHHCMEPGSPVRWCLAAFLCHEVPLPPIRNYGTSLGTLVT